MASGKVVDLLEHLDFNCVECLNQSDQHTWENALKKGYRENEAVYLESDTDEQLLIHIPFNQVVKLHSIVIRAPSDGTGPKRVRLFINRTALGFSEASDEAATQDIELSEEDISAGKPLPLKFVKFQSVRSVSVFIESNQDEEETTKLGTLKFMGSLVETTNMADFKAVG
mmetsp:Transcript_17635/g.49302  ORF Transcript_17635/g.49302 Transcript_17635/m.49302 type:complete len:170 (-) Transcript_17635:121-630(-)